MNKMNEFKNKPVVVNDQLIDLFSWTKVFEAILNCFFDKFRTVGYDYNFDEDIVRNAFIKNNLLLIVEKILDEKEFDRLLIRLHELHNWSEFQDDIIKWFINLKLQVINKWLPITARYTTINLENVAWINWKLLELAKQSNFDILSLLDQIEIWWSNGWLKIKRDRSYFDNLNSDSISRVSWIIESLSSTDKDIVINLLSN